MSSLAEFLGTLFEEGRAALQERPDASVARDAAAAGVLAQAFAPYRLQVAGPNIDFAVDTGLWAARLLHHACWFLVSRDEPESELEQALTLRDGPKTPADHLSADLTLHFLPSVYRRAKAHDPADRLTTLLATVLRHWPLSGVLADLNKGPKTSLDFCGHAGLQMLYAERLANSEKPAWMPEESNLEYVVLVYNELGKKVSKVAYGGPHE